MADGVEEHAAMVGVQVPISITDGPLDLYVLILYPEGYEWVHAADPDNCLKGIMDAFNKRIWADDSSKYVRKVSIEMDLTANPEATGTHILLQKYNRPVEVEWA